MSRVGGSSPLNKPVSTLLEILPEEKIKEYRAQIKFQPFLRFYATRDSVRRAFNATRFQPFLRFYVTLAAPQRGQEASVFQPFLRFYPVYEVATYLQLHRLVSTLLEILQEFI
jgi:hypothetical protein